VHFGRLRTPMHLIKPLLKLRLQAAGTISLQASAPIS